MRQVFTQESRLSIAERASKMSIQIQFRRDSSANWTANNPILAQGEMGIELDSGKIKIGNGSSTWTALSYFRSIEPAALNLKTISNHYSIPEGYNAFSVGPVTISNGAISTIPSGSTWLIG